jgi:hypothetical protein
MRRRDLLKSTLATAAVTVLPGTTTVGQATSVRLPDDRAFWLRQMQRVAHPVLDALSHRRLKERMPVEAFRGNEESRHHTTYLEAFARTLSGLAPWLEHGPAEGAEGGLRLHYVGLACDALAAGVDPHSPDYLEFGGNSQTLVDAAFLSLAVLRAPQVLGATLHDNVRRQLAEALRATRPIHPPFNNWLLFSAAVEAALFTLGESWEQSRVDNALHELMNWYVGDGAYGDGPHFHWDYYNSFVMHPFLLAILDAVGDQNPAWKEMIPAVRKRATRYAHVQERLIAPDGSYPVLGRSITYRCGAFHLLADVALRHMLPEDLSPEQVRCALAAVIHRTLTPEDTFDSSGWLRIGLSGHQPALGESYISTGSLYLCTNAFLPLGLSSEDRFWSAPGGPWSSQKLWSGVDLPADHAIEG